MSKFKRYRPRVISARDIKVVSDEELESLFIWVDEIPLSRPKKNLSRDFADGVMVAELVHHFIPTIVEKHNYQPANGTKGKKENWMLFDRKVLSQLGLDLTEDVITKIINAQPWAIERVLIILRDKITEYLSGERDNPHPEADQNRGARPSGYNGPGGFNKSQSLQNLSRPRRGEPEKVPIEHLFEKERLIEQQTATIEMLTEKIQKLEHLCDLKDRRIEDMSARLLQLQTASVKQPKRMNRNPAGPPRQPPAPQGYYRQQPQSRWN